MNGKIHRRATLKVILVLGVMIAAEECSANVWQPLGEPGSGGWPTSIAVSPHDPDRVLLGGDILGIGISLDGGDSWGPTFGFKSWEIGSISWHPTDPDIVWAGTMSGPYKSVDGGVNWEPKRNGMGAIQRFSYSAPIEEVLYDPNNSDRLIAFGGSSRKYPSPGSPKWGAIWESLDGGDNWDLLSTVTPTGSSPGDNNGVPGVVLTSAAFAGGSSDVLYAVGDKSGFYRSIDGGNTWAPSNTGLSHLNTTRLAAHPTDPSIVYTSLTSDGTSPGGIFKSVNGGLSWSLASQNLTQVSGVDSNFTSRYEGLRLAPSNPDILYTGDGRFGTSDSVSRTTNGAGSWNTVLQQGNVTVFDPAGVNVEVIGVDPNNADRVFVGTSAHIIRTEDGGATWDDVNSNFLGGGPGGPQFRGTGFTGWVATAIEFNPLDPDHMIVQGLDAARGLQTKNGGESWSLAMNADADFDGGRDVAFAGPFVIYGTHGQFNKFSGLSRSVDGGNTWQALHGASRGLPEWGASVPEPRGIYALPSQPGRVWAVVSDELLQSTNFGNNWSPVSSPVLAGKTLRWIAEDQANPSTFYVSGTTEVFRTTDAGATFESIGGPGRPGRLEVDSNGVLYLASHDGNGNAGDGVWKYDGTDWEQIFDNEWVWDITIDPNDPLRIVATTSDDIFHDESAATGVYLTIDGGTTWAPINENLPMTRAPVVAFNPHNSDELVLGTSGRGFFMIDLGTPGDLNNDGAVDTGDLSIWQSNLGATGSSPWDDGDADGDGDTDVADLLILQRQFGATGGGATVASLMVVPEPSTLLLALAGFAVLRRRR